MSKHAVIHRLSFLKRWLFPGVILMFTQPVFTQSVHGALREGDRHYNRDNYKEAEKSYRKAADLAYSNPKALYNLGNALYQQGNWEDSAERFDQAAKYSTNTTDQANALHNLGNALLKQRKFKEAVAAYENSLRLRPGDDDSKVNLQLAKKKLKQEEEQKKQQQQQQQQNQQQQQDGQQDPNQPQQPEDKQNQAPPQSQPQQNPKQQNQSENAPKPQQQPEQPESGKMKKEEARRMLETAVGPEDQRNARKYRSAEQQHKPKGSKKDW